MSNADPDRALVCACEELKVVFARYIVDCASVDDAEFNPETALNLETAWSRAQETLHHWRTVLKQINRFASNTKTGAAAKTHILRQLFAYGFYFDEDVMALTFGLTLDLDKLLREDADCTCQDHLTAFAAAQRKKIRR